MNELLINAVGPLREWFFGLGDIGMVLWIVLKILAIAMPVIISVAFYVVWERKLIGWMHVRHGPMYVGMGIFQAFADVFKLLFKEIIQPSSAQKAMYVIAPLIVLAPAFAAWAVVPFDYQLVLSNANAGSLNLTDIVMAQSGNAGFFEWFWLPLFPLFIVYWVSGVAETNRSPFDVVEGESEIVAGHMVEYSGAAFALFFLAEYANMILVSFLVSLFFLGGWLSPLQGWITADVSPWINWIWTGGWPWLLLKVLFFASAYIWFRASFPRYRYDQIMRLGWKVFIPLTIFWIAVTALLVFFGVFEKGV